jgi:xylulokinase
MRPSVSSGTIFAYAEVPVVDPGGELAAFCDSTGAWLPLVCTMNVTSSTEMVRAWFNLGMADLTREAAKVPAGADNLLFLPYLEGERTPNMPAATGVFYGLRKGAGSPGHLMRAAMEGATLGLRYGLDILRRLGIDPKRISLVGGGAQNPVWRQICADVFGSPVVRSIIEEAAAYGAALQACWATTGDRSGQPASLHEIAAAWAPAMQEAASQEADPESVRRYDEVYDRFRRLTDHLKPLFAMNPS